MSDYKDILIDEPFTERHIMVGKSNKDDAIFRYHGNYKDGEVKYIEFTINDIMDDIHNMILEYNSLICRSFFVD